MHKKTTKKTRKQTSNKKEKIDNNSSNKKKLRKKKQKGSAKRYQYALSGNALCKYQQLRVIIGSITLIKKCLIYISPTYESSIMNNTSEQIVAWFQSSDSTQSKAEREKVFCKIHTYKTLIGR